MMSLILAAIFNQGAVLCADSFYFDNDGDIPYKGVDFDKFSISQLHRVVLTGVGSRWVQEQAGNWLRAQSSGKLAPLLREFSQIWANLNREWISKREREIQTEESATLRPLSRSLCFLLGCDDTDHITICDAEGKLHTSQSFAISGSGSLTVRHFLKSSGRRFTSRDTLEESLDLVFGCYQAAGRDLYVTGFPSLVLVARQGISDLSRACQSLWQQMEAGYFESLRNLVLEKGPLG